MTRAAGLLSGCALLLYCTPSASEPRTEPPARDRPPATADREAAQRTEAEAQVQAPPSSASAQFTLGGIALTLTARDGTCVVRSADGHTIELAVPAPCDFHRSPSGAPRVESPDGQPTVLVEWSVPDAALPSGCDTRLQALRVRSGRLQASEHVSRVAACPPFQWDVKVYSGLFE